MSEEKGLTTGAKKLWDNAVKVVRGDNTNEVIEEFTSEMTLVAEGLCEDQSKLRQAMDTLATQQDRRSQKLESDLQAMDRVLVENQRMLDTQMSDLDRRMKALEKQQQALLQIKEEKNKQDKGLTALMRQATTLVSIIAGAWVLVTILRLFQ